MKKITKKALMEILRKHALWLEGDPAGEQADLSRMDLRHANLSMLDLHRAILGGADLSGADLTRTNLGEADLSGAVFYGSVLFEANLSGADCFAADFTRAYLGMVNLVGTRLARARLFMACLDGADLRDADAYDAEFYGANLRDAKLDGVRNLNIPIACPEEGAFIGFKKVWHRKKAYIVKLEIPAEAKRCSAAYRKCRCEYAKVLSITKVDGSRTTIKSITSKIFAECTYTVGEIVRPDSFDEDRFNTCSHGIHFFITRQEAVNYH